MPHVINEIFEEGVFKTLEEIKKSQSRFVKLEIKPLNETSQPVQEWIKKISTKISRKKITL